jgi:hypothetical protein
MHLRVHFHSDFDQLRRTKRGISVGDIPSEHEYPNDDG